MSEHPAHLTPSELGTKEYWDKLYTREITNHAADPNDIGTVWFDDSDAESRVISFLSDLDLPPSTSFLDLGSGNGSLLFSLREEGWAGRALGVDYSQQSVDLARQVTDGRDVEFAQWDVLRGDMSEVLSGSQEKGWDVVLDKGTFDAVSLSEEVDGQGRRPCEGYRDRVLKILKPRGLFVVTSCNWTEKELEAWFVGGGEDGQLVKSGRVEYPSFEFGGMKGQTISTLCFRKE